MKKILKHSAVLIFSVFITYSSAYAWPDGDRTGLLMGITAGGANVEFESDSSQKNGAGFMAGTVLGAGLNEQFLFDFKFRYWNSDVEDITFHTWSWCGDAIFFPMKDNGFFLNAGFGRALVLPDVKNAEGKGGTLFYGGIGYEIIKYIFLSIDYGVGSFDDNLSGNSITFAASVIGY